MAKTAQQCSLSPTIDPFLFWLSRCLPSPPFSTFLPYRYEIFYATPQIPPRQRRPLLPASFVSASITSTFYSNDFIQRYGSQFNCASSLIHTYLYTHVSLTMEWHVIRRRVSANYYYCYRVCEENGHVLPVPR